MKKAGEEEEEEDKEEYLVSSVRDTTSTRVLTSLTFFVMFCFGLSETSDTCTVVSRSLGCLLFWRFLAATRSRC
jgi:hypothetical protein